MIEVTLAGFYSSVQDLGRLGYRHLGVGMSGAMDTLALSVANVLVGNPAGAAALEITMGLAAFTFHADTEIALGGASAHATLDGRSLPNWWAVSVKAGQVLRFGALEAGVRSYVAVRGGLDVQPALGSASTDLKGGFGGLGGRPLKNGDRLSAKAAAPSGRPNRGFGLSPWRPDPYQESRPGAGLVGTGVASSAADDTLVIHILPAAQWGDLTSQAQELLTSVDWETAPESNRVGCRLDGPELPMRERHEMRSHGIMPGVVQLPPAGRPIVQLCDGNTSGGYPVVATVIQADLHHFAQMRPKARLRFELCDIAQAQERWARRQRFLDALALRCELTRSRFS